LDNPTSSQQIHAANIKLIQHSFSILLYPAYSFLISVNLEGLLGGAAELVPILILGFLTALMGRWAPRVEKGPVSVAVTVVLVFLCFSCFLKHRQFEHMTQSRLLWKGKALRTLAKLYTIFINVPTCSDICNG